MAKRPDSKQATETLEEIESLFDRLADWVTTNPTIVLGVLGGILGIAAAVGITQAVGRSSEESASTAIGAIERSYREAMGAKPGQLDVPELANPETGRQVRADFSNQLQQAAAEHDGSRAAVRGRILAGTLQWQNGEQDAAIETWKQAAEDAPGGPLQGLALLRLGAGLEAKMDWAGAADVYGRASQVSDFPGRFLAMAQTARSWLAAGDEAKALEAFSRLEAAEPPIGSVPAHLQGQLEDLKARSTSAQDAAAAS